jgi:hypothetical protein
MNARTLANQYRQTGVSSAALEASPQVVVDRLWPLLSGLEVRRGVDVEAFFGILKYNHDYDRFRLFGLDMAETEIGLLGIAHNIRKWISAILNPESWNLQRRGAAFLMAIKAYFAFMANVEMKKRFVIQYGRRLAATSF